MKINKNALLQNIILIGFAFFMIKVNVTGEITYFVHPKMNKFIFICGILFTILALFNCKNLFIKRENHLNKSLLIFVIPLCLALFVPPTSLSANTIQNKGINLTAYNNASHNNNKQTSAEPETKPDEKAEINVTEDNFTQILYDLHDQPDDYMGQKIQISGYIYKNNTFNTNQFVIGRTMVACCTADASLVGLMCEYKEDQKLNNDEWYVVTGQINKVDFDGMSIPGIEVTRMEKINKPVNEYVYP